MSRMEGTKITSRLTTKMRQNAMPPWTNQLKGFSGNKIWSKALRIYGGNLAISSRPSPPSGHEHEDGVDFWSTLTRKRESFCCLPANSGRKRVQRGGGLELGSSEQLRWPHTGQWSDPSTSGMMSAATNCSSARRRSANT
ncbi:hypothetical protein EYF80_014923 [Liparis tanakae]|uniref:Uncharacterized protein n=1 Tax=Liparis tanakae TaxID=230148 RepID=A0A4Z2ICK5_9TELE|nr:hypothetical protein EYF80_014923 [Liparis tanakae]